MKEKSEFVFDPQEIRENEGLEVTLTPGPEVFADAFNKPGVIKDLRLELAFSVTEEGEILLDGKATAELNLECSRCSSPVTRSYSYTFDEEYPDSVECIDTRELIRETVSLLEPMKVLCSEGCKGFCPICGNDRNKTPCSCSNAKAPKFEALKDFKIKKDGSGS